MIQPICLGGLVAYFSQTNEMKVTQIQAYMYATFITLSTGFVAFAYHPFAIHMLSLVCQLRVACSGLIYRKVLRLKRCAFEDDQNGKIINLLANDLARLDEAIVLLYMIWLGPLKAITFTIVIYMEIGFAGIIGMIILLISLPLQGILCNEICSLFDANFDFLTTINLAWIGKLFGQFQMQTTQRTDVRVKIMNEILQGIQVIKMYAWEKSFSKIVDTIRR